MKLAVEFPSNVKLLLEVLTIVQFADYFLYIMSGNLLPSWVNFLQNLWSFCINGGY